jgi:methylated-DNA-protein-cysteine methyltransferase-like protein
MAALHDESDVPWHRVINARGEVSPRTGGSTFERLQRALLEAEGIHFDARGRVDLDEFGWP